MLYEQWRQAREKGAQVIDAALARKYMNPDAAGEAIQAFITGYDADELAATERFVREALRLPQELPGCEWWVAMSLLRGFRIRVYNEQHPTTERLLDPRIPEEWRPTRERPRA
jgi:hypothetical protein